MAETLWFAWRMRRVSDQGAVRQVLLMERARAVSRRFANYLLPSDTNLVIQLPLLPFLWVDGYLGGRTFTVLATMMPMDSLQARLDDAYSRFPDRVLLADYRAPAVLARAEREALAHSSRVVTPHSSIASEFGSAAELLPWQIPGPAKWTPGPAIGFPGPGTARKGAYEVREAARMLGLPVVLGGRDLEGGNFWGGVDTRRGDVLDGVFAVVQPALLEDRPRGMLRALAAGCPIVCTAECGIAEGIAVKHVSFGEPYELAATIRSLFGASAG